MHHHPHFNIIPTEILHLIQCYLSLHDMMPLGAPNDNNNDNNTALQNENYHDSADGGSPLLHQQQSSSSLPDDKTPQQQQHRNTSLNTTAEKHLLSCPLNRKWHHAIVSNHAFWCRELHYRWKYWFRFESDATNGDSSLREGTPQSEENDRLSIVAHALQREETSLMDFYKNIAVERFSRIARQQQQEETMPPQELRPHLQQSSNEMFPHLMAYLELMYFKRELQSEVQHTGMDSDASASSTLPSSPPLQDDSSDEDTPLSQSQLSNIGNLSNQHLRQLYEVNPFLVLFMERFMKDARLYRLLNQRFLSRKREYEVKKNAVSDKNLSYGIEAYEGLKRRMDESKNLTFLYHASHVELRLRVQINKKKWACLLDTTQTTNNSLLLMDGQLLISELMQKEAAPLHVLPFIQRCAMRVSQILSPNQTPQEGQKLVLHRSSTKSPYLIRTLTLPSQQIPIPSHASEEDVFNAIDEVLFNEEQFSEPLEYYKPNNAYISESVMLRTGIPITLCTIYQSIAEVLGIFLEPRAFPMQFMLSTDGGSSPTIINVFKRERYSPTQCAAYFTELMPQVVPDFETFNRKYIQKTPSMRDVYSRMFANLVNMHHQSRDTSDKIMLPLYSVASFLNPSSILDRLSLLEVTIFDDLDESERVVAGIRRDGDVWRREAFDIQSLEQYLARLDVYIQNEREKLRRDELPEKKYRGSEKYRVGQVICHEKYDYRGVICGHDSHCKMGVMWIQQMGVDKLLRGRNQPFYNVLVHSSDRPMQSTYVAEDNICIPEPAHRFPVDNDEVGKYFQHFDVEKREYVANERTAWIYPNM